MNKGKRYFYYLSLVLLLLQPGLNVMANATVIRKRSVDHPQDRISEDRLLLKPPSFLPSGMLFGQPSESPYQFTSLKRSMEPQEVLVGKELQQELALDPGNKSVESMEKWAIRMRRNSVSQTSQTEDEKQPNVSEPETEKPIDTDPETPKLNESTGEDRKAEDPQPQDLGSKVSTLQDPKPEDFNSEIIKPEDLIPAESKYQDRQPEDMKLKTPTPKPVDLAMTSLISQLDQTLRIEDKATTASKMVEVPSGYKLDLEVGPEDFYKMREQCKLLDKRKRAAGLLPMSTKQYQRYGFRPEELLSAGALYSPNAKPSNLTNKLHPFLHRSRFDDTPDTIYDQLVPGLRLATMFMTQPICCQYWVTLANGPRKHDFKTSNRLGRACLRISKDVPLTLENATEIIEYIKKLDDASIIHFTFRKNLYLHTPKDVLARTRPVCDVDFEIPEGLTFRPKRSHVCLHHDFYTAAKKLSRLKHPDPALLLRFNFFLACNILHEMAHAVNVAHCYSQQSGGLEAGVDYNEPFLLNDSEAELGNAWENYMFGGRVAPINGRVDTSHGLSICDWPYVGLPKDTRPIVGLPPDFRRGSLIDTSMDDKQHIWRSIPMKFIENIQQTKTWEKQFDLTNDTKIFHIKRNGAISITMNRFTTMPWSEELRIVSESLAEGFANDPDDGPPTKKRVIGTGKAVRTDIFGRTLGDESEEDVEGKKGPKKPVKGSGLQGTKTKQRGHESKHLKLLRIRNSDKKKRQEAAERRNAGPH